MIKGQLKTDHDISSPEKTYFHVVQDNKTPPKGHWFYGIECLIKQQDKETRAEGQRIYGDNNFKYFIRGDQIIFSTIPSKIRLVQNSETNNTEFKSIDDFLKYEGIRKRHIPGYFLG